MGQTSIPCDSGVRDRLAEDKPDDMSWSEYLSVLHSDQEIVVEGNSNQEVDTEELAAELEPLLEGQDVSKGPAFDDIVGACRKALRDELPERVLSR